MKARNDAIKNALAKDPSQTPKEEVVVNETLNTNTVVTQRNRKKKEVVVEPNKTETNVASNEEE